MRNADLPAMPQTISDSSDGSCLVGSHMEFEWSGLTKREMFAMHAPSDIPEWFKSSFIKSNYSNKDLVASFTALTPESANGEMALLKAWRYAYADLMLEDE